MKQWVLDLIISVLMAGVFLWTYKDNLNGMYFSTMAMMNFYYFRIRSGQK